MKLLEDYRMLHQIPELGDVLPKTAEYIKSRLKETGCSVFTPSQSALCAFFDFGGDHAIAFRADMDGLPIREETGLSFSSRHPGQMHACGHDGHMAMLLSLARWLSNNACKANVLLIFQPAEETTGGAQTICRTGILEKYAVKAIFGMHLWPGLEKGEVFSRKGPMMSRSCEVTADIWGRSAHISRPEDGLDALQAGVELYRQAGLLGVRFGKLESGSARNILAGHCRLEGTLRTFDEDGFEALLEKLRALEENIAQRTGCQVCMTLNSGYPAVVNPAALYEKVQKIAPFQTLHTPSLATEDFSFYQKKVPGLFFFLGAGNTPPLHSSQFQFDETVLQQGTAFWKSLAKNWT